MQDRPRCLKCAEVVEYDPVYEAPCGHDDCPSAVFHGLCLMEWREYRQEFVRRMQQRFRELFQDHNEITIDPEDLL
jgi:hypothetical protein